MKLLDFMGYKANVANLFKNKNYNSKKRFQKKALIMADLKDCSDYELLVDMANRYGYKEWCK